MPLAAALPLVQEPESRTPVPPVHKPGFVGLAAYCTINKMVKGNNMRKFVRGKSIGIADLLAIIIILAGATASHAQVYSYTGIITITAPPGISVSGGETHAHDNSAPPPPLRAIAWILERRAYVERGCRSNVLCM